MIKAKKCILLNGGVEKVNVFTRITLALYGQITWSSIPFMPIEIMFFQIGSHSIFTKYLIGQELFSYLFLL